MPSIISRQQAIDEINKTLSIGECLVCDILKSTSNYCLYDGAYVTVVLSQYPRTWGQTMILLKEHKTSVTAITAAEWLELSECIRKTTIALEAVLQPLRCYISSLGATENLPNTSPHIHFNCISIYNTTDKPATIYTWEHGVIAANKEEWVQLVDSLKPCF
jgi:diadenosine tetraphosphate (Ap4A) HIT family hydrolase